MIHITRKCALLIIASLLCASGCSSPANVVDRSTSDFTATVQRAKDKVFPAVVFVKCVRENYEEGRKQSQEIAGSGVIISASGEVLTNWHVLDKATEVRCLLYDGRAFNAKVIGTDKDTDLGLMKLEVPPNAAPLPYATLGDSSTLKAGDFVMAMGAPWGMARSVSMGIISCTRRFLPGQSEYSLWLQTDASICPGNSGGPLVNTAGEVIGINTLGSVFGEMGFSVPTETIRDVVEQVRKHGRVEWSWTGIQPQPLMDFDHNSYFEAKEGVMVADTDPDSPARFVGIMPRDRIIRLNGQPLNALTEEDIPSVCRTLGSLQKLQPAKVEIMRGDKLLTFDLTPREKGKVEGDELDCPRWGLTVKAINQFSNPDLYFYRTEGVFIFGVQYPGNAENSGLRHQDIILEIDGREVKSLDDVRAAHKKALENIDQQHKIQFKLLRNGMLRQVILDFMRDYERE